MRGARDGDEGDGPMRADRDHDVIFVRELTLLMHVGVEPFEEAWRQRVSVSLRLLVPASVRRSGGYVSYAPVVEHLRALAASGRHVPLIETLAEEACRVALEDARVERVEATVAKRDVFPDAAAVGITIAMGRDEP